MTNSEARTKKFMLEGFPIWYNHANLSVIDFLFLFLNRVTTISVFEDIGNLHINAIYTSRHIHWRARYLYTRRTCFWVTWPMIFANYILAKGRRLLCRWSVKPRKILTLQADFSITLQRRNSRCWILIRINRNTVIIAVWLRNESNFGTFRYARAKLIRSTTLMAVLISYVKETIALGLLIG